MRVRCAECVSECQLVNRLVCLLVGQSVSQCCLSVGLSACLSGTFGCWSRFSRSRDICVRSACSLSDILRV